MKKMISYCGIKCHECVVYRISNRNRNNNSKKKKIAKKLSNKDCELKVSDINCAGCKASNKEVPSFVYKCEIRKCAKNKSLTNCSYCKSYPCKKIDMLFVEIPTIKKNLNKTHKKIKYR